MGFPFRVKPTTRLGLPGAVAASLPDPEDELDESGGKMSFLDHLDELRKRLVASALALAGGALVAFLFIDRIFAFIMLPLSRMMPKGSSLIAVEPTETFMLYVKMGLLAGVVIEAPLIAWQLWLFIAPGLYAREKRFAAPFVLMATVFFVGGAAFSHYLVFPWAWKFLATFQPDYVMFAPRIEAVFSLYAMMLLAMGVVFEMPAVILILATMGLVTAGFLWRNIKYAVLIIFVAAAVITPTGDMVTQSLMAGPMIGLYLLSILLAWLFGKKKPAEDTTSLV
jgi:sec-independent protein translocase protein TatC